MARATRTAARFARRPRLCLTLATALSLSTLTPLASTLLRPADALALATSASHGATKSTALTNATLTAAARAFTAPSTGVAPTITVSSPLPRSYDPLTHLTAAHTGDRVVANVLLGPTAAFPALGNDAGIDDCALVAVANISAIDALRSDAPHARVTRSSAIVAWHKLNGGAVSGVSDTTLLSAWAAPAGVLNTHIAGWSSLDVASTTQLKSAIKESGGLYARLLVPANLPWTSLVWHVATTPTAVVGHAVALVGWNRSGWIALSWGEVVLIPWSYWNTEGVSAYAVSVTPRS
jgi:hypothetical protein